VLEIDVMQTGPVYTLVGVAIKKSEIDNVSYSCAVSLGRKLSKKKLKNQDIKSVEALLKAIKQMVIHLRGKKLNIVKVVSDEDKSIEAIDAEVWGEQLGVIAVQLPTGVHAKHVEQKQRNIKDKMRACTFCLPWAVPISMVPYLVVAAVNWCNMDFCESNSDGSPPMMLVNGNSIDQNSWCIAHFGEFVMAPVTFTNVGKNRIDVQRRVACVYMHPLGAGNHRLLLVDSLNKDQLVFVKRRLKPGMVHNYMPSDVIARLNSRARKENADFNANGDREVVYEFNDITGYVDGDDYPLGEEFLIRSPVTLNYQHEEAASQDEEEVEDDNQIKKDDVNDDETDAAAIHLVKNGRSTSDRTKHILLRHFFVKQYLDDGTFILTHCKSENMIADILTKPLQGEQFFKLRAILLGYADV